MSALGQKRTHAPQQISSLLDHLVGRFVAAWFLDAEDHAVGRIGLALRHDRGDYGPAQRGNRYGLQVHGMRLATASFD